MHSNSATLRAAALGAEYEAQLSPRVRKLCGVWFTPPDLARALSEQALATVLADRTGIPAHRLLEARGAGRLPDSAEAVAVSRALRGLRVLDPAAGAGAFLVALREAMVACGEDCDRGLGFPEARVAARAALRRRHITARSLYGTDIDPGALAVARRALGLEAAGSAAAARLVAGDALLELDYPERFPEVFARAGGFDLVVTNPPYVRAAADLLRRRARGSGRFESLAGKWDLSVAFVERCLQLCRPGGLAMLLLPDSYRRAAYARPQHAWLLREHGIRRVELFDGLRAFAAAVDSMALFVERSPASRRPITVAWRGACVGAVCRERLVAPEVGPEEAFGAGPGPSPARPWVRLEQVCFISYGLRANSDERRHPGEFVTRDLVRDEPGPDHPRPYTEGKNLGGFRVLRTRYLEWGTGRAPGRFARRSFEPFLFARPKILALCISGGEVRAAIDHAGHAFNHTIVGILPWRRLAGLENAQIARASRDLGPGFDPALAPEFDLRYLLAVLHARQTAEDLACWRRSDKHIYPDDWRRVRVPLCSQELEGAIAVAVERLLQLPYPSEPFEAGRQELQALLEAAFA